MDHARSSPSAGAAPPAAASSKEPAKDGEAANREVAVDWEALEDAFENNAPEVHSYLQLATGEVIRVVDGVADPQMHARIAADAGYLRVDPVSSREQYRWMERFIPMVDDLDLRGRLSQAIDGKGAFRRFKDVLMAHAEERERWFTYRSERLKTFMDAWLAAHSLRAVARPAWVTPPEGVAEASASKPRAVDAPAPSASTTRDRRRSADALRRQLRDVGDTLGPRDLEVLCTFAEFLRARRAARTTRIEEHEHEHEHEHEGEDDAPTSSTRPNEPESK